MQRIFQYHALVKKTKSNISSLRRKIPYRKTALMLQRKPFVSFFLALGILLLFIIAGNTLRSLNKKAPVQTELTKSVQTFTIGKTPTVNVQAKVEKTGVVRILAQTSGIVDSVNIHEGEPVTRGGGIVTLASTYSGANAPGIQAQLARNQYQNVLDTYETQKSLIATQRTLAETSRDNANELRAIAERSLGDTQELLRYNETMLALTNQSIGNTPSDPQDSQFTNSDQAKRSLYLATVVQVRAQLRGLEQQIDKNRAPNKLADLQKDATLTQLSLQEKALDLQKESARLQAALAGINESLMRPSSPFTGVVQRVYVRPGQSVNPGTPIATVSQGEHAITAVATVPYAIAQGISADDMSTLTIGKKKLSIKPDYVSTDATDGQLYSIKYTIPLEYEKLLTDGQSVAVSIPVGADDSSLTSHPFIPLDSVYQTQTEAFAYVINGEKATAKKVTLGNVFGRFVEVEQGLTRGDIVILTRNVVENDSVQAQ